MNTTQKGKSFKKLIKTKRDTIIIIILITIEDWDSSVGITTCYGPYGPEIESRCCEIFRTCPDHL
jgi:hypothetical protein